VCPAMLEAGGCHVENLGCGEKVLVAADPLERRNFRGGSTTFILQIEKRKSSPKKRGIRMWKGFYVLKLELSHCLRKTPEHRRVSPNPAVHPPCNQTNPMAGKLLPF
jgi:hypothetical protein